MSGTTSAVRQAAYIQRRKNGLQPVATPWDWLTLADIELIAKTAYKVASYQLNEHPWDTLDKGRSYFVEELYLQFGTYLAEAAAAHGMPVTVVPGIGPNQRAVLAGARQMRKKVADWRPQYPIYKEVTPASVRTTPGAVINDDEGTANDRNFTR